MSESVPEPVDTAEPAAPFDPEQIIAELDAAFGRLPEAAMRAAREHKEVMAPRLIRAIQDATVRVRAGQKVEHSNTHFFALFLLAEWKAKEALPAILEAISLPGEGPFDLFEDAITSVLAWILVVLPDDPLILASQIIRNRELNEYVRWQGALVYLHLVKSGRLTREAAVERLREHLRHEMNEKDESLIVSALVSALNELAPTEARQDIQEAFRCGMVDRGMIGMESIDRSIAEGEAGVRRNLEHLREFDDAIEELGGWVSFQPIQGPGPEPFAWTVPQRPPLPAPLPPVQPLKRGAGKQVGRNDPCPCGSGKKYKKCCMDKERNG